MGPAEEGVEAPSSKRNQGRAGDTSNAVDNRLRQGLLEDYMNEDKNRKKLDPYHFYAGEAYGK